MPVSPVAKLCPFFSYSPKIENQKSKIKNPMNVCLLIPAYNEERAIGQVVSKAREIIDPVVVVDDGSQDATAQIAQDSGALVLKHHVNSGKGAALRTGFQYALDHGYDAVITMDSDGQHDVDDIPKFLEVFEKKEIPPNPPLPKRGLVGIILGSRMHDISTMPTVRRFTNKLTSFVGSLLVHQELKDSQSGFRLISSDVLRAVELETSGYEMESELLIKASKSGFRITSVPIKTIYGQEVSKISPVADTCRFFRLLFRSLQRRTLRPMLYALRPDCWLRTMMASIRKG
jgi:glycosyltransferase involved in cell wall biosynthesis